MLAEPFLVDDSKRLPTEDYLKYLVLHSETIICLYEKRVMGVAIFHDFGPRHAMFAGWIAPEFRSKNKEAREAIHSFIFDEGGILEYAWQELNLIRLEGRTAIKNESGIRFGYEMGFRKAGELELDLQFNGQLFDSVLFELVNPEYAVEPLEESAHEFRRGRAYGQGHASGTVEFDVSGSVDVEAGSGDDLAVRDGVPIEPA